MQESPNGYISHIVSFDFADGLLISGLKAEVLNKCQIKIQIKIYQYNKPFLCYLDLMVRAGDHEREVE